MTKTTKLFNKNISALFLICLIFSSCNNIDNNVSFVENFPINKTLKSKSHTITKNLLLPTESFIFENKLIVYDGGQTEIFKVFSLPNLKYLYSWGNIGRGPNEFRIADSNTLEVTSSGVDVKDIHSIKHIKIESDSVVFLKETKLPLFGGVINRLRRVNDSIFFADNETKENDFEHVIININKKMKVGKFGKYPDEGLQFERKANVFSFYGKDNVISLLQKKFATIYYHTNKIKIYDLKGKLLNEINIKTRKENKDLLSKIVYNIKPYATDKYIYMLNSEIVNKKEMIDDFNSFRPKLNIWDWNGNPIASYSLDRPISDFSIDEGNGLVYATSFNEINSIYTFTLPKINTGFEKK